MRTTPRCPTAIRAARPQQISGVQPPRYGAARRFVPGGPGWRRVPRTHVTAEAPGAPQFGLTHHLYAQRRAAQRPIRAARPKQISGMWAPLRSAAGRRWDTE
jgi:hypothetical protein